MVFLSTISQHDHHRLQTPRHHSTYIVVFHINIFFSLILPLQPHFSIIVAFVFLGVLLVSTTLHKICNLLSIPHPMSAEDMLPAV